METMLSDSRADHFFLNELLYLHVNEVFEMGFCVLCSMPFSVKQAAPCDVLINGLQ